MASRPREHRTGIKIDREGNWTIDGSLIRNPSVLDYFKRNLHRDERGFYVFNEFGSLKEKGYLEVEGPVMRVLGLDERGFRLENGDTISPAEAEIVITPASQERLYLKLPALGAWAIFARQAVIDLSERLYHKEEQFYWGEKQIKTVSKIPAVLPWGKE